MKPHSSASINSGLKESSLSNCKYEISSVKSTFPISLQINPTSIQPIYTVKLNQVPTVSSTSLQNSSMSPFESCPPPSITTNGQGSEEDCTPNNKEANQKTSRLQYLPIILKFLGEQLTSQIPLLFASVIGLVIIAMVIGQASGGIKLKLDLEVSPAPSQSEKNPTTK